MRAEQTEKEWILHTEGKEAFSARVFCQEECPEAVSRQITATQKDGTVILYAKAWMEEQKPLFGPQKYWDLKKGFTYQVQLAGVTQMLAVYQHKDWWIRPEFPDRTARIPDRTQMLLCKTGTGYVVVMAMCGSHCRTDIKGTPEGLEIRMASNCYGEKKLEDYSLILADDPDPYRCCEKAVWAGLAVTGRSENLRRNKKYPEMFDGLGWCSWDAFYHEVTADGIYEKLKEMKEKQIPVRWVLIDDGWLDADYDRQVLKGLDADKKKFPEGLGGCVRRIKQEFGIEAVGVWHAVMGYWNGVEEGSDAFEKLQNGIGQRKDQRLIPEAEEGKAFQFYHIWHEYLKNQCGIDFVKVDGQSAVQLFYEGEKSYGEASRAIQCGLQASAALHFGNSIINCMGMSSEDVWNRFGSAIARSSDDFVPDVPHGFREHAVQNSYNSLLQGPFFWGDWDMFWSDHEENRQNSILRAVSGGPVYTSDKVGRTNPDYLMPLIRKNGEIIRCREIGMPTADCLFENPVQNSGILKIFNRYEDLFVLAAFHVAEDGGARTCRIRVEDIPEAVGKEWDLYRYKEQRILSLEEDVAVEIEENDAEIFLLLPKQKNYVLGILEKYVGAACVESAESFDREMVIRIGESGTLGVVLEGEAKEIFCNGSPAQAEAARLADGRRFYRISCMGKENESCTVQIIQE